MQLLADMLRASIWAQGLTSEQLSRAISETTERRVAAGAYVTRKTEPVEAWLGIIDGLSR